MIMKTLINRAPINLMETSVNTFTFTSLSLHIVPAYQLVLPSVTTQVTIMIAARRLEIENPSKSSVISLTPIHQAKRTANGTSSKEVCIHLSKDKEMLMSIFSCIAMLMAIGSTLSNGRMIRLRNVCDTCRR